MIKRFITNTLQTELNQPEINFLLGARQVGKTTILQQLENYARRHEKNTSFFDLEQYAVLTQFNKPDAEVFKILSSGGQVIFIDEFQYLKNASKIFKAIFDAKLNIKIYCSGSSSLAIHSHLKESLAGRRFLFNIYPLQFCELTASFPSLPLEHYFVYGGMPALTHTDSDQRKQLILSGLISSYIIKDIKALVKEENIRAFNHLFYLLAERQGSLISLHSLANEVQLSAPTIQKYLTILEETYVNYRIYSYSTNLGNELKKSCKTYLYDLGIRNSLIKDFSPLNKRKDKGILLESFVFLKLKTILAPNMDIKFWRTKEGNEVDFILLVNRKPIPIEVKSGLTKTEVPQGLKRFLSRYPGTPKAYVINESLSESISYQSCTIKFITLKQFTAFENKNFD